MKTQLTIFLLSISIGSFSQTVKFKDVESYGSWLMNYYKNPNSQYLFEAFKFGAQNKEIAKAGSRTNTMGFFASCLRHDTMLQSSFFEKLQTTRNKDLIYGFGLILWYIHSDYSLEKFQEFENLKQIRKYKQDFGQLRNSKFTNIWTDSILDPDHLDMLWADFFATGNPKSIEKIISKLADYGSTNYLDKAVSSSAKWSLTSNSINHEKVFKICKEQMDKTDEETKKILEEILIEASKLQGR